MDLEDFLGVGRGTNVSISKTQRSVGKPVRLKTYTKSDRTGVYKGRKPSVDVERVKELKAEGLGASAIAIAKQMGIGRASVYRALGS
jgi:DNA invertase Pin-like site-specific DNA recombinase